MRAVVLVGGFGTRLRPLTLTTPKAMLPVVDRPLIEHLIAHLAGHGVDEAVLSLGYRPDAFRNAYPDGRCAGVRLHYAVEPEPLDTAGAIAFAAADAGIDERFLVVNGDVLTDLDVGALVAFHEARGAEGTIALHPVEDPTRFGVVPTDAEGRVEAFVEKPPLGEAPTNLINAGTYVLETSMLARIPPGRRVSIERETFPATVADGSLYAMAHHGYWLDMGTPAQYLQAQLDLLDGVRGPALDGLATDAAVAVGASVRRSVVGSGAVVERGALIVDSAVLPGAMVRSGAKVISSIVASGGRVGEGAVLDGYCVVGTGYSVEPGAVHVGDRLPSSEEE